MAQLSALVGALAHDDAALRDLRHDPPALGRSQHLTPEDVAALSSADRFFTTEAPILDQPRQAASALPRPQVAGEVFRAAQPAVSGITASPDTGTLLPGPTSGTYTITSTATATSTSTPVPGQPAPGPRSPAQPVAPGPPPSAPVVPGIPQPSAPGPVPPTPISAPAELAVPDGGHCSCEAAIVAIVAEVSATANAAITAITAIARQRARAGHVTTKTQ